MNSTASALTPTAAVSGLIWSILSAKADIRCRTSPGVTGMPSRLGSSPMITRMVRPKTKPVTMGLDKNSATQPTRRNPARTRTAPAASAMADV